MAMVPLQSQQTVANKKPQHQSGEDTSAFKLGLIAVGNFFAEGIINLGYKTYDGIHDLFRTSISDEYAKDVNYSFATEVIEATSNEPTSSAGNSFELRGATSFSPKNRNEARINSRAQFIADLKKLQTSTQPNSKSAKKIQAVIHYLGKEKDSSLGLDVVENAYVSTVLEAALHDLENESTFYKTRAETLHARFESCKYWNLTVPNDLAEKKDQAERAYQRTQLLISRIKPLERQAFLAWNHLGNEKKIDALDEHYGQQFQVGYTRTITIDGSLGASVGLPGAIPGAELEAGASVTGAYTIVWMLDDEGYIGIIKTKALGVEAHATANFFKTVKASAAINGAIKQGEYREVKTSREFATYLLPDLIRDTKHRNDPRIAPYLSRSSTLAHAIREKKLSPNFALEAITSREADGIDVLKQEYDLLKEHNDMLRSLPIGAHPLNQTSNSEKSKNIARLQAISWIKEMVEIQKEYTTNELKDKLKQTPQEELSPVEQAALLYIDEYISRSDAFSWIEKMVGEEKKYTVNELKNKLKETSQEELSPVEQAARKYIDEYSARKLTTSPDINISTVTPLKAKLLAYEGQLTVGASIGNKHLLAIGGGATVGYKHRALEDNRKTSFCEMIKDAIPQEKMEELEKLLDEVEGNDSDGSKAKINTILIDYVKTPADTKTLGTVVLLYKKMAKESNTEEKINLLLEAMGTDGEISSFIKSEIRKLVSDSTLFTDSEKRNIEQVFSQSFIEDEEKRLRQSKVSKLGLVVSELEKIVQQLEETIEPKQAELIEIAKQTLKSSRKKNRIKRELQTQFASFKNTIFENWKKKSELVEVLPLGVKLQEMASNTGVSYEEFKAYLKANSLDEELIKLHRDDPNRVIGTEQQQLLKKFDLVERNTADVYDGEVMLKLLKHDFKLYTDLHIRIATQGSVTTKNEQELAYMANRYGVNPTDKNAKEKMLHRMLIANAYLFSMAKDESIQKEISEFEKVLLTPKFKVDRGYIDTHAKYITNIDFTTTEKIANAEVSFTVVSGSLTFKVAAIHRTRTHTNPLRDGSYMDWVFYFSEQITNPKSFMSATAEAVTKNYPPELATQILENIESIISQGEITGKMSKETAFLVRYFKPNAFGGNLPYKKLFFRKSLDKQFHIGIKGVIPTSLLNVTASLGYTNSSTDSEADFSSSDSFLYALLLGMHEYGATNEDKYKFDIRKSKQWASFKQEHRKYFTEVFIKYAEELSSGKVEKGSLSEEIEELHKEIERNINLTRAQKNDFADAKKEFQNAVKRFELTPHKQVPYENALFQFENLMKAYLPHWLDSRVNAKYWEEGYVPKLEESQPSIQTRIQQAKLTQSLMEDHHSQPDLPGFISSGLYPSHNMGLPYPG